MTTANRNQQKHEARLRADDGPRLISSAWMSSGDRMGRMVDAITPKPRPHREERAEQAQARAKGRITLKRFSWEEEG